MRRDMDLIRELLLRLEALPMPSHGTISFQTEDSRIAIADTMPDEIEHHLVMLFDAGFVASRRDMRDFTTGAWSFSALTWSGRDFLDAVREPKMWQETKSRASAIGGWTAGILRDLAVGLIKGEATKHGFPIS